VDGETVVGIAEAGELGVCGEEGVDAGCWDLLDSLNTSVVEKGTAYFVPRDRPHEWHIWLCTPPWCLNAKCSDRKMLAPVLVLDALES
jgi:hypothetical protein